jgi:ketosteroid isomerase-like protein
LESGAPEIAVVQEGLRLFNEGELERSAETFDPEIVWDTTRVLPDGSRYEGREAVLGFWRGVQERWDDFRVEGESWENPAPGVVVMFGTLRATGAESGVPVETSWNQVWQLRDGRPVLCLSFADPEMAAKAAAELDRA